METAVKTIVSFDKFTVDPLRRVLFKDGEIVNLNPKTFDLLLALIERHGEIVSKNDLLNTVWADQFVEENNLTVHIAALRKAFGEKKGDHRFIVTVPGSGYRFVAALIDDEFENEFTIESHRFERVVIEEEIEDQTKGKIFQSRRLHESQKSKTNFQLSPQILLSILGFGLIAAIFGFWFWSNKNPLPESKKIQFAKLTSSGKVNNAAFTPDGKYAVFSQTEADGESLWLKQVATGSQKQILPAKPIKYVGLTVSPESDLIYATVFGGDMPDPQIWRVPLLGGVVEEIKAIQTGAAVSLSPDGKRFAFTESRRALKETHFGVADSDGSNKRILIRGSDGQRSFANFNASPLAWSPDGGEIAVALKEKIGENAGEKARILLVDPNDGSEKFITEKSWDFVDGLAWIDAENLAFIAYTTNPWQGRIWTISKKTGAARRITNDLNSYSRLSVSSSGDGGSEKRILTVQETAMSHLRVADFGEKGKTLQTREIFSESGFIDYVGWAIDGRIVYTSSASGKREIWRVDADGSNPTQLSVNAAVSIGLSVSPVDGSLVFCSIEEKSGKYSLYLTDAEGKNARKITEGTEDVHPNFTPDGQSVIFQRGLNNKAVTLWRINLSDGKTTQLTESHATHPAVSPDAAQTAHYFMDRESGNLWRVGLISNATGSFIKKLDLPSKATERRMRWHPNGEFVTQIFYVGENANLLLLPIDGSASQEVSGFGKGSVNWFEWSPDGKKIIVSQTEKMQDAVLISEF